MTVLTRWEPFREFSTLQDRMNRLFRESYSEGGRDESLTASSFAPAVDVYEDEHNVTLKIEAPGINEKDLDIQLENNTLSPSTASARSRRMKKKRTIAASSANTAASLVLSLCPPPSRARKFRPTTTRAF